MELFWEVVSRTYQNTYYVSNYGITLNSIRAALSAFSSLTSNPPQRVVAREGATQRPKGNLLLPPGRRKQLPKRAAQRAKDESGLLRTTASLLPFPDPQRYRVRAGVP